ncbi:MAG: PD-(D/E)XK nuclease family protein [Clostridia bacterium]|nr:PD-(D/E)XK nuclease family protein [Clostridia bacterium]
MITLLFGPSGTGKSHLVRERIARALEQGSRVMLLCLEQEAIIAESLLTEALSGRIPTVNLEIQNFDTLPERIFRQYGGAARQNMERSGRRLLMHRVLEELAPQLTTYGKALNDLPMADKILTQIEEFKMCRISPARVEQTGSRLPDQARLLRDKLTDFSLLYASYNRLLHTDYADLQDELDRLDEVLSGPGRTFFAGYTVFLDGFRSFTPQQYRILFHMFETAEQVTVTVGCPVGADLSSHFRPFCETRDRLLELAKECRAEVRTEELTENRRAESPALRILSEKLWQAGKTDPVPSGGDVRIFSCTDPYAEADAVAADIRKRILAGARYREIAVISRDISRFQGTLDTALEQYGIPYYMSRRSELSAKPLLRYITQLFAVFCRRYRRQDVIGLLKTDLTPLDRDDIYLFENYLNTWNLSGEVLRDETEWGMHPDGYREVFSDIDRKKLEAVNRVKSGLSDILSPFYDRLSGNKDSLTVRTLSGWLWDHLESAGIPEKLAALAEKERSYGLLSRADETDQLWKMTADLLDMIVAVWKDTPCTVSSYAELFAIAVQDYDIGTIPARCDEVIIGDAASLRTHGIRHVYLIGCNDGVFPKSPSDDSIFSDPERDLLERSGMKLVERTVSEIQDEWYHFWSAAVTGSRTLTVTYPFSDLSGAALRPSVGVERIRALFSDAEPSDPGTAPAADRILAPAASFPYAALLRGTPTGDALEEWYRSEAADDPSLSARLEALDEPIVSRRQRLSRESLLRLFPGPSLSMTQSRLERYAMCHFSYYCDYILKLKEQKRAVFGAEDIGLFLHSILEQFAARYAEERESFSDPAFLREFLREATARYFSRLTDSEETLPGRVKNLVGRLQNYAFRLISCMVREFAQSDFVPADFELPIGGTGDKTGIPALVLRLPDGTSISLRGIIDRVDLCRKDGQIYARVVDYKTYVKKFSKDDLDAGINTQLLLYLLAVQKNGAERYGGMVLPAGILYVGTNPAETVHRDLPTEDEIRAASEKQVKRSGLLLRDESVLSAMEHGLEGKYLPVRRKADGSLSGGDSLATPEEFGELETRLTDTVCKITGELRGGNADAVPLSRTRPDLDKDPCGYCPMKPICRAEYAKEGRDSRA